MVGEIVGRSICKAAGIEKLLTRSRFRWLEPEQIVRDFTSVVHLLLLGAGIEVRIGVRVQQKSFKFSAYWRLQGFDGAGDLIARRHNRGKSVLRRWRFNQHLVVVLRYINSYKM